MTLEELLEHVATEHLDDRTDLVDGDPDSLWSDALIVRHLNEAQRILCRRSWVIIDTAHPSAGVVVLKTGQSVYPLHKSVLRVLSAGRVGADADLGRAYDSELKSPRPANPDWFDIGSPTPLTGEPLGIATDTGTRQLRVAPVPVAAQNGSKVLLRVARMPVCWLDLAQPTCSPEVPEDWHMAMCEYAAGKCLTMSNVDSEGKNDGRALLANFYGMVKEARQERERADMAPARWGFNSPTAAINGA